VAHEFAGRFWKLTNIPDVQLREKLHACLASIFREHIRAKRLRQLPSGPHPADVVPIISRIGCCTSKRPQSEALRIDFREIGHAANQRNGISVKPGFAVHQMLNGIVCAIANEWLWINHQPRFSFRP
jgi:hypothetical protein